MGPSAFLPKAEAFPCAAAESPGRAAPGPAKGRRQRGSQRRGEPRRTCGRGPPGHLQPAPRPFFCGAAAFAKNPVLNGSNPRYFHGRFAGEGRPWRAGLPEPLSPLPALLCQGNLCGFTSARPNSEGWCGDAQRLPGVVPRRALPASSAEDPFTSNCQKINVLRTALLICYN